MVQNSWLSPTTKPVAWDISDILELAAHGTRSIVSVSHIFTTGPKGGLHPDFEHRWTEYLANITAAGALGSVLAWYPSDEPDIRMPAKDLNTITATIKSSCNTPVLVTLSNLAMDTKTGVINYAMDAKNVDILTFDMYCHTGVDGEGRVVEGDDTQTICTATWPVVKRKLDVLNTYAARNKISTAVILDGTKGTYSAVGGTSQAVFNNQILKYCANSSSCMGVLDFAGGNWDEQVSEGVVYQSMCQLGESTKSGDFLGTVIDPGVACTNSSSELFQIPCKPSQENCNLVASVVFGMNVAKNKTVNDVLPKRTVTMEVGSIWRYETKELSTCREITNSWSNSTNACTGDSVACWHAIQSGKSEVVDCQMVQFVDKCDAKSTNGAVDFGWTCCERSVLSQGTTGWSAP
jgi:hypothetical protein